jgi:uncharacterized membrane protein SpoIIM required for sporulation
MVLEQLYDVEWLKEKPFYGFVLGLAYAMFGIGTAILIFPNDPALIAVAITSLLLMPSLYKISKLEEKIEGEELSFSIKRFYYDNKDFFKIYIAVFFGILVAFSVMSMMLPTLATNHLFREQLDVLKGSALIDSQNLITGNAHFNAGLFRDLINNNLRVMLLCFALSLVIGNGAIFLITWNASVWGTIFGNLAKTAALGAEKNPYIYFALIIISVLPHMILEISSYIFATISGSIVSQGIVKERAFSSKLANIIIYNVVLLLVAAIILILASLVETYVLGNFQTYQIIIWQGYMGQ